MTAEAERGYGFMEGFVRGQEFADGLNREGRGQEVKVRGLWGVSGGRKSSAGRASGRPNHGPARVAVSPEHRLARERSAMYAGLLPGPQFGWSDAADYLPGKLGLVPKGQTNIFRFKDGWVSHHRDAILDAAAKYRIPPELLAGVAHIEAGGNPPGEKSLLYWLRENNPFDGPGTLGRPPEWTSMGDVAIQPRRAAEAMGTDWKDLSETQREALRNSLQNPVENLYIVAKHLADLRDIDARGVEPSQLTPQQIRLIGARYNAGPQHERADLEKTEEAMSYGRNVVRRLDQMADLLGIEWENP